MAEGLPLPHQLLGTGDVQHLGANGRLWHHGNHPAIATHIDEAFFVMDLLTQTPARIIRNGTGTYIECVDPDHPDPTDPLHKSWISLPPDEAKNYPLS